MTNDIMTHRFLLFCLLFSLLLSCGCKKGPKKPEGFPDLIRPVTVKIHKDGTPLKDITVILHSKGSPMSFLISGDTDANGIATLQTSRNTYVQPGVPSGKFLVQLTEVLDVDIRQLSMEATPQEALAWQKEFEEKAAKVRSFPKTLTSAGSSPLEMEVSSSSTSVEFDVSKY